MSSIGNFTQDWKDMPREATFEELIASSGYHNYIEKNGRWYILMKNGAFYRQDPENPEIGRLCSPIEVLDKCAMRNFNQ
jgi:hypothetical protein